MHLVYDAARGCPLRAEFETELYARMPEGWLTSADTRRFEVRIVRDEEGAFSGRLDVRGAGLEPSIREIRAVTCRAVSTSIAIFLVLALDPATASDASAPKPPARDAVPPRPASRSHRQRKFHARWIWSSGYAVTYLHAGEPAAGGRVHLELARMPSHGSVGVAARLSWGWSDFSLSPARVGETKFRYRTARLEGCAPAAFTAFVVSPCAGFDIGTLRGRTVDLPRSTQVTTRWLAATANLRARWSVADWLAFELHAGAVLPLERTAFLLEDPPRGVYRAPSVLFEGGAGVVVSGRL